MVFSWTTYILLVQCVYASCEGNTTDCKAPTTLGTNKEVISMVQHFSAKVGAKARRSNLSDRATSMSLKDFFTRAPDTEATASLPSNDADSSEAEIVSSSGDVEEDTTDEAERDQMPQNASLLDTQDGQSFWIPPSHGAQFSQLMEWRRRSINSIRPERILRMSHRSFLQLLRREHQAADSFGNSDGCVTSDEHPDFSLLAGDSGRSFDRICASHVHRYANSRAFRRDVSNVRLAHRKLLLVLNGARKEALAKVEEELKEVNEEIPLNQQLIPDATDLDVESSVINLGDLKAELSAEEITLQESSDTEYALDAGLVPFPFTDKDEEDMDVDKLQSENNKTGSPMTVAGLQELVEREHPEAALVVAKGFSTPTHESGTNGATFTVVYGPCQLSADRQCVTSPRHPGTYGNSQSCYIKADQDVTLHLVSFDTESRWDWFWVNGTYYSGRSGPRGIQAQANKYMYWYSDYSVTRTGWKICTSTQAAQTPCLYGRHDVCALQLQQVPMLGAHNSGSHPTLYLECGRKKQECVDWATRARSTCNQHVYECTNWGRQVRRQCNNWGSQCTSWSNRYCGWFGWLCGTFCSASRTVCTSFSDVTIAVCHGYGWVCKGFTYFVEYVGCNVYKWACEQASNIGFIGCLWENQGYTMLGQLARGVRFFDVDSCLVDKQLFHCHGTEYEKRAIGTAIDPDVRRLRDWLVANPHEVLVFGWSNKEDGKSGVDYPSAENGGEYHDKLRENVIKKYFTFTSDTGRHCSSVCYTEDRTITLSDMISNNIRLMVGTPYRKDSYEGTADAQASSVDGLISHLVSFCDGTAKNMKSDTLPAGESAGLSAFTGFQSQAVWSYGHKMDYNLECPNHCTHPNGQPATCECKAGQGQILELKPPDSLVEGNSNSSYACQSWNAGVVNPKVATRLSGIVDRCFARNSPVSAIMLDYVGKSNGEVQAAVQLAISKAVAKFRCDWQCYLNRYADLQRAFGATNTASAESHWKNHGQREGRDCTCPA